MTTTEHGEAAVHERAAQASRERVAEQFAASLHERDLAGDRDVVARRVLEFVHAERSGDLGALRAAAMEIALAAGELCVTLDLSAPALPERGRRR